MSMKITQSEYDKVLHLATSVSNASTKKAAEPYLTKLRFISNTGGYTGPARNVLGEVVAYAQSAAGRVSEKAHWQRCLQSSLYKLTSYIGDEANDGGISDD